MIQSIYVWPHDETVESSHAEKLAAGSYIVSIQDFNGCATNFTYEVPSKRKCYNSFIRYPLLVVLTFWLLAKSQTGVIAGASVGAGIFILGLAAFVGLYAYRQRKRTVQLLVDVRILMRLIYSNNSNNQIG